MARQFYSPEVKAKIIDTVQQLRGNKRPWSEVHAQARLEGFKGKLPALLRMISAAKKNEGATTTPPSKKRGRPKKMPAPSMSGGGGMNSIEKAINAIVKERVAGLIRKIRSALDEAERAL